MANFYCNYAKNVRAMTSLKPFVLLTKSTPATQFYSS